MILPSIVSDIRFTYRSFAYYTVRERLPVILTKVLDQLSQDRDEIAADLNNQVRSVCAMASI